MSMWRFGTCVWKGNECPISGTAVSTPPAFYLNGTLSKADACILAKAILNPLSDPDIHISLTHVDLVEKE